MGAPTINKINYSPGLMSILPLFYIGWADGVLSPGESQKIKDKIDSLSFLSPEDKNIALHWSAPTNPPTDEVYQNWHKIIIDYCDSKNADKNSIIDLGIMLAKDCDGCEDPTYWANDETKAALVDLQSCMGVANIEFHQHLSEQEELKTIADFEIKDMTRALDKKYFDYKAKIKKLLSYPSFQLKTIAEKDEYLSLIHISEPTRPY